MLAGTAVTTGAAALPGSMNRTEGRGGKGDEEPRSLADCGGNTLAAEETRTDKVEGVPSV